MGYLLDVNVLISLCDANHVFHDIAWSWFDRKRKSGWATCPITENGLVRIITNPSYPNRLESLEEAISLLKKLIKVEGHQFIADSVSVSNSDIFQDFKHANTKNLTDIYLIGLSRIHKVSFATFDRKIPISVVSNGEKIVEIIC